MRIATYNVSGIGTKADMVLRLWNTLGLDLLGLTETWMRPTDRFLLPLPHEAIALECTGNRYRSFGGVALARKPGIPSVTVFRERDKLQQVILSRVHGIAVAVAYFSPECPADKMLATLDKIHSLARGPAVIMGDLNCRNVKWDRITNRRGRVLHSWAEKWRWNIQAAPSPSFRVHGRSSNIDLFVLKGVTVRTAPWLPHGDWDGMSDHHPVVIDIHRSPQKPAIPAPRIAWWKRKDSETIKNTATEAQARVPRLTVRMATARTPQEVNKIYNEWAAIVAEPFIVRKHARPPRFRSFWNTELDNLAKARSRAYKEAKRLNTAAAWGEHLLLDRQVKRLARQRKRSSFQAFTKSIQEMSPSAAQVTINRIMRAKKGYAAHHRAVGAGLCPETFTNFYQSQCAPPREVIFPAISFEPSPSFSQNLLLAVSRAPKRKAPGPDLVIGEALRAAPKLNADFLEATWRTCGKTNCMPKAWMKGTIIPLHKKGDTADPANYRPITLLSHARKVVEKALDIELREKYKPSSSQFGFQQGIGTEAAIVKTGEHIGKGLAFSAFLDLKAAYDKATRDKIITTLQLRLQSNLAAQIIAMIGPLEVQAIGDDRNNPPSITRGVPQGSPLSPSVFNIFMDVLADMISRAAGSDCAMVFFADDVQLRSRSSIALQRLLDVCTSWAESYDMTWSIKKCHIIPPNGDQTRLTLAGQPVMLSTEAEYLGVSIDSKGVSASTSIKRVSAARARLQDMVRIGMNARGLSLPVNRRLYLTFIRPVYEYALHLTPLSPRLTAAVLSLEKAFFTAVTNIRKARPAWARSLLRLPDVFQRRAILRDKLQERAEDEPRISQAGLRRVLAHAQNDVSCRELHELWNKADERMSRKLPKPPARSPQELLPAAFLKRYKHRTLALKWYLHHFPMRPSKVREAGEQATHALEVLDTLLRLSSLSAWQVGRVEFAIDKILQLCPL